MQRVKPCLHGAAARPGCCPCDAAARRPRRTVQAIRNESAPGPSGGASEQKLSALRQSLLHEYARQLDSIRNSRSTPGASSSGRMATPKTKAAAQQLQLQTVPHLDEHLATAYLEGLPGQLLHQALSQSSTRIASPPTSPAEPPAPATPSPRPASTRTPRNTTPRAIQQRLWTETIQTHLPTAALNDLPDTSTLALPTLPSSAPPATPSSPPSSPAPLPPPGYDWINPRRKQLMKLPLRDDLVPLAKHYGLDLYKTKAEAIQQLLEREFSDFLAEREESLMQLPSREQLVPLARSYGIDPSGFKRDLVKAIIRHEFRRLTEARRQQLESCSAGDLMSQVHSRGIDLLGDKGLLVGRILVHEAKLRAHYCSQLPSAALRAARTAAVRDAADALAAAAEVQQQQPGGAAAPDAAGAQ